MANFSSLRQFKIDKIISKNGEVKTSGKKSSRVQLYKTRKRVMMKILVILLTFAMATLNAVELCPSRMLVSGISKENYQNGILTRTNTMKP